MSRILKEWHSYLEEETAAYCSLSEELSKLLQPYALTQPAKQTSNIDREATRHAAPVATPYNGGVLADVTKGLERASRVRQRAAKNLLSEVELDQTGSLGERHTEPVEAGYSVVSDSVLQDLITKHCRIGKPSDAMKVSKEPGSVGRGTGRDQYPQNGKKKGIVSAPSRNKPTDESETKGPAPGIGRAGNMPKSGINPVISSRRSRPGTGRGKPPSSAKANMYKTSSSDIGKGVRKAEKDRQSGTGAKVGKTQKTLSKSGVARVEQRNGSVRAACHSGRLHGNGKGTPRNVNQIEGGKASQPVGLTSNEKVCDDGSVKQCDSRVQETDMIVKGLNGEVADLNGRTLRGKTVELMDNGLDNGGHRLYGGSTVNNHPGATGRAGGEEKREGAENSAAVGRHMFDLIKDGGSIEIPTAWKKLLSSNRKWRSKIMKKSSSASSSTFLERFNIPLTEEMKSIELDKQYGHHIEATVKLSQEMSALEESGSDLEPLIPRLEEIKASAHYLHQMRNNNNSEAIAGNLRPPITLRYSSLQQLETYTDLQLRLRFLEYTKQLEQELTVTLLDLIERHPGSIDSRMYRKLEGLLAHGAELFPSMIICSGGSNENS